MCSRNTLPASDQSDKSIKPKDATSEKSSLTAFDPLDDKSRSEEHTSELQSPCNLVCRLLLEKKKINCIYTLIRYTKISNKNLHSFLSCVAVPLQTTMPLLYILHNQGYHQSSIHDILAHRSTK